MGRMERLEGLVLLIPVLFVDLGIRLEVVSALNDEGLALLRFREVIYIDPYGSLSNWERKEDEGDPCSWNGVHCEDGSVVSLDLRNFCLKGIMSPELGKLIHLKYLVFYNNSIYGTVPREIGALERLEVLDLGHNNISGPLPSELGNLLFLEIFVIRGNQFLDNLSPELIGLPYITDIHIDDDPPATSGRYISRSRGNATIRRLLEKTKRIPPEGQPRPENASPPPPSSKPHPSPAQPSPPPPLETKIAPPKGQPRPENALPPSPSSKPQPPTSSKPSPPPSQSSPPPPPLETPQTPIPKKKGASLSLYLPVAAAAGLLVLAFIYSIIFCVKKGGAVKPWAIGLSGQLQKAFVAGVPVLKRSELETACEDFSNIIGSTSDGTLYKGTLSSGVEIAVNDFKPDKDWLKASEAQFRKKIATLSKLNHKNFVNLLGYSEEEEPFTRMMVFEYAPNGDLFEHLHVKESQDLGWGARLRIAMGVAYCLDHMHQLDPPVVLENLSSSMIYFTDDFAAKIADMGLWSATTETGTAGSGPSNSSIADQASIVHKFGVLLLELISGRPRYSEETGDLLNWASDYMKGARAVRDMVDPSMGAFCEEQVSSLFHVAKLCLSPNQVGRPPMKEVAAQLREITSITPEDAAPRLSPLWWAELEIVSTEAT